MMKYRNNQHQLSLVKLHIITYVALYIRAAFSQCAEGIILQDIVDLFSPSGISNISGGIGFQVLLEISIDHNGGNSPCVCDMYMYKTRVVYLDKALADITAFKALARSFQSQLKIVSGPLKRCKVTCGSTEVSPDTCTAGKVLLPS